MAKITVLMPVYDCEKYLKESIDSILAQTFQDFEFLIIIEYGTNTSTLNIIASYHDPRIHLVYNQERLGLSETLNRGLILAKGQYIARMDTDDIAHPRKLDEQFNFMENNPDVGICGTWAQLIGTETWCFKPAAEPEMVKVEMLLHCPLIHPTVMFRKSAMELYDLKYNSTLHATEDYELWHRAIEYVKIANIPKVLLSYRKHEESATLKNMQDGKEIYKKIMISQLKRLGIDVTESEADLHYQLFTNKYSNLRVVYPAARNWFFKIMDANKKAKIYNQKLLECYLKNSLLTYRMSDYLKPIIFLIKILRLNHIVKRVLFSVL